MTDPPRHSSTLRHLLLDLDGTLLGIRMTEFIPAMMASMERHFRGVLASRVFADSMRIGFGAMVSQERDDRTVLETFLGTFSRVAGLETDRVRHLFETFYDGPFRRLSRLASPLEGSRRILEAAAGRRIGMTLATNPIFPRAAVAARVGWAGLDESAFTLVTTAEVMHACKPSPAYYREVARIVGVRPSECLMAGNDRYQDLAASEVGMKTFLVENGFETGDEHESEPDFRGSLADLADLINSL